MNDETRKKLLKLHRELNSAIAELQAAEQRKDVDLPAAVAELQQKALAGDEEALRKFIDQKTRLDLMPGVVVTVKRTVDRLEANILRVTEEVIQGIRTAAREALVKIESDFMSQSDRLFGGDLRRTKAACKGVLENCEARRWIHDIDREPRSLGAPAEIGPRIIRLADGFEKGLSLSAAWQFALKGESDTAAS